eukprot:TRINITY_DN2833_c0_g1_i1.p1 TRINITY_DN2833_c0_g1~~TRINITY_DN2833_c0_g1_i1.p1  ORF type:complete len:50 (-),score=6.71 TRINITY_DN2833_c0_g1_i1:88-237(-)
MFILLLIAQCLSGVWVEFHGSACGIRYVYCSYFFCRVWESKRCHDCRVI